MVSRAPETEEKSPTISQRTDKEDAQPLADVDSGNGCGWADLADLVAAMASGDTYVNVHTLANLPGEIRGQLN